MRKLDLNLLVVFDAIMREGSMTRAATQLAMTQPAVSNAVARMRVIWDDPIFVKEGRGIAPTPFAHMMWDRARPHLDDLMEMANPEPFDVGRARRTFRIGMADYNLGLLWLDLQQRAESMAPGIDFHAVPLTDPNSQQQLIDAEVDVEIAGPLDRPNRVIRSQALFDSQFVCAMRPGHPLANGPLSLEAFTAANHLLMSFTGDATGFVDDLLKLRGLSRRVAMTVNQFSLIATVLKETNLISIVPYEAVAESARAGDLHITHPPIDVPPITVTLLWHKRTDRDVGQRWLRQQIQQATQQTILTLPASEDACGGPSGCGPMVAQGAAVIGDSVDSK